MTLDHHFLSKQSALYKLVPSPANQNIAPMEITVLKFKGVLGYRQSQSRLAQYAPGLQRSVKFKALQVPASIWELEYDEKLVTWEDVWERMRVHKLRTSHTNNTMENSALLLFELWFQLYQALLL